MQWTPCHLQLHSQILVEKAKILFKQCNSNKHYLCSDAILQQTHYRTYLQTHPSTILRMSCYATAIIIQGITFNPECVAQSEIPALAIYHKLNYSNYKVNALYLIHLLGKINFPSSSLYSSRLANSILSCILTPMYTHKLPTSESLFCYHHSGCAQHLVSTGSSVGTI